jgi:cellobiose phosphorylase
METIERLEATLATMDKLQLFNGIGGFAKDGREYVTVLRAGQSTPAPWINVVANPGCGFQVATEGSGYTWAGNSRENQLTPWSNDPVTDAPGEAIYVSDEDTRELFSPTALPIRDGGVYIKRHGRGYSHFEHTSPMWSRRTSTPSLRITGAAAGPSTRARRDGCTGPASRRSWAFAGGARSCSSIPAFRATGRVSR